MKVQLYSADPPNGRCLLLVHKLRQVTSLSAEECLHLAQRLFDFQYIPENPTFVEISEKSLVDDLTTACACFGISVEIAPRAENATV